MLDAPCVVCLAAQRGVAGMKKGEAVTDKGDWFMYDSGIAMEHLVLAAWSLGLGTVHVGAFDAERAEEALAIPAGFSVVAMTPLGYFEEQPVPGPERASTKSSISTNSERPITDEHSTDRPQTTL